MHCILKNTDKLKSKVLCGWSLCDAAMQVGNPVKKCILQYFKLVYTMNAPVASPSRYHTATVSMG